MRPEHYGSVLPAVSPSCSSGQHPVAGPGVDVLREPILGLADDQSGSLWIATANHVLRINRDALLQGHLHDTDIRKYGLADGLRGTEGVKRDRSVAKDLHGDIWFSLNVGLSVVHPNRANHELLPAAAAGRECPGRWQP